MQEFLDLGFGVVKVSLGNFYVILIDFKFVIIFLDEILYVNLVYQVLLNFILLIYFLNFLGEFLDKKMEDQKD